MVGPRAWALVPLAIMSLSFIAGTHAALAPGNYTLRLPGRSGCTARGFLSARACSHPFPKTVTLTPELTLSAGTGLQVWQLQPVAAGVTAIKNTTKVYLKVGRPACGGNSYATSFLSCTGLSLSAPVAGSARQQWLVEAWGATYRLRPAAPRGVPRLQQRRLQQGHSGAAVGGHRQGSGFQFRQH